MKSAPLDACKRIAATVDTTQFCTDAAQCCLCAGTGRVGKWRDLFSGGRGGPFLKFCNVMQASRRRHAMTASQPAAHGTGSCSPTADHRPVRHHHYPQRCASDGPAIPGGRSGSGGADFVSIGRLRRRSGSITRTPTPTPASHRGASRTSCLSLAALFAIAFALGAGRRTNCRRAHRFGGRGVDRE